MNFPFLWKIFVTISFLLCFASVLSSFVLIYKIRANNIHRALFPDARDDNTNESLEK